MVGEAVGLSVVNWVVGAFVGGLDGVEVVG